MTAHVLDQLDDLVDGRLDAATARAVRAHLGQCAECAAAEARLQDLLAAARALPASIEPPAEVWAAVRARTIDLRARRSTLLWSLRYPLAAAAVVLMLLSSGITLFLTRPRGPAEPSSRAAGARVALNAAEQENERIARELEDVLNSRASDMDTATIRIVQENILIIDAAIADARAALHKNPDNQNLSRLISTSYQRKIQMLERTLRLSARS